MSSATAAVCRLTGRRVFATDLGGGGWDVSAYVSTDRWFHAHLHISEYSRRISHHDGKPWARVILGGVDTVKFSPDSSSSRTNRALFVGRLLPHKGRRRLDRGTAPGGRARHCRPAEHDGRRGIAEGTGGREADHVSSWRGDAALVEMYRRALCLVLPSVYRTPDGAAHGRAGTSRADVARSDGLRDAGHLHARGKHAGDRRGRRQLDSSSSLVTVPRCDRAWSGLPRIRRKRRRWGPGRPREGARALSVAGRRGAMPRRVPERMIHFLTPEYPPRHGGVADYTHQIATELSRGGETVHVWGPSGSAAQPGSAIVVHSDLGRFPPSRSETDERACSTNFPHRGGWSCSGCRTDSDSAR